MVHVALMVSEGLQGGTRLGQLSVFLYRKIYSQLQIMVSVKNSCIVVYFPYILKMASAISISRFVHVAFLSILVRQTFERMIFGRLSFP